MLQSIAHGELTPHTLRKPTDKEALKACRLLLKEGFRAFSKNKHHITRRREFVLTSGNRSTWPAKTLSNGTQVWRVNPNECNLGFAEIIHSVSHWVHNVVNPGLTRQHGGGHNGHAMIELHLVEFVQKRRWIEDGMKIKPSAVIVITKEHKINARKAKLEARLSKWLTKQKRANTAVKKLQNQLKRYARLDDAK